MLSARGSKWAETSYVHGAQEFYDPVKNPHGVVEFIPNDTGTGEIYQWDREFLQKTSLLDHGITFDESLCGYGEYFTGTQRLRQAMASHLNEYFAPVKQVDAEEITFAAGVTILNETCALVTCNPDADEAIMVGGPIYGSFSRDLCMRTGVTMEVVAVGDTDQFTPACVAAYEAGYEAAKARGRTVKALLICNPHNPLGHCYPRETLVGLMQLCARKGIHLISDEIYALSVFERSDRDSEVFTSVLSIDTAGLIDPNLVHVLYGMSKDFAAPGTRLGCVISRNREFTDAVRAVCRFGSPSQFSMHIAASLLQDKGLLAEALLSEAGIDFHAGGNAGMFLWINLSSHLPLAEANGEGWAAEKLLAKRLLDAGVKLSNGETYNAPEPGRFRLVYALDEHILREGIRRISDALQGSSV
ncbi:hypothetical protein NPX13_g9095 [Xylaria arbuscula]|uniref:Aminotransferase class I/classII large domain-containing protein n=1 Tax=Xylaria arbuscula TaxID=114810 RepID=A0A9W8TIT6_9PEZI|nr:hypothetical protein NPX13_g9095 [Xylaria arbuscula]